MALQKSSYVHRVSCRFAWVSNFFPSSLLIQFHHNFQARSTKHSQGLLWKCLPCFTRSSMMIEVGEPRKDFEKTEPSETRFSLFQCLHPPLSWHRMCRISSLVRCVKNFQRMNVRRGSKSSVKRWEYTSCEDDGVLRRRYKFRNSWLSLFLTYGVRSSSLQNGVLWWNLSSNVFRSSWKTSHILRLL